MSGDVQPRKRKDKRRRRDDEEGSAAQSVPLVRSGSTEHHLDSVTIHVHKEAGTGGHWCARIIFFVLLAGLLGVVGLIILEHRGTTDVDTPVTASQWAMIFEGWVDETPAQHEDEHKAETDEQLDASHEEEEEDEELNSEHEEEDEEHEEDDSEECSKPEEEPEIDKPISVEEDEGFGVDDEEGPDQANDADDTRSDDKEAFHATVEKDETEETDHAGNSNDEDEGFSKENFYEDFGALEEIEEEDETDDNMDAAFDSDLDFSLEGVKTNEDEFQSFTENAAEEYVSIPGVNAIDDNNAEPLEEIDGEGPEEIINEMQIEVEEEEDEKANKILEEESTSVAMKFGVGVALIVTAHFVLVRRWSNDDADAPEILKDSVELTSLSRRNTLVPPVCIKEASLKHDDQVSLNIEQGQIFEDLHTAYKTVVSKDKKRSGIEEIFAKKTADLELMLRGESKDAKTNISAENKGRQIEEQEYSEGENDYEDYEEYDDEEMEEDYEDEGEEGGAEKDKEEDVDDTELVEKLNKKYGKLPTPLYSDHDDEDEEEEEKEEEEEEDDDDDDDNDDDDDDDDEEERREMENEEYEKDDELAGWNRVKAHVGSQITQKDKDSECKANSGGQQEEDYLDDSLEDLRITEETGSRSSKMPGF